MTAPNFPREVNVVLVNEGDEAFFIVHTDIRTIDDGAEVATYTLANVRVKREAHELAPRPMVRGVRKRKRTGKTRKVRR